MALMDRREFLKRAGIVAGATGAAAAFGSLAGCSSPSTAPHSTTSAPPTTVPGPVTSDQWSRLGSSLSGTLVVPSDPTYGTARLVYNERFDGAMPAAIALCQTPTDVQHCVNFARANDVPITARSGGHSYGGYSSGPGLVVDLAGINSVAADASASTATIGGGALLIDVYSQLGSAGLLLPAGSCATVGIAGLTLGGGIGVFDRKYGLTCDNLTALEMVTADGRVTTCNAHEHPELFWACRGGGGGNFGIVTSFTFDVHPVPPIALFTLQWPWSAASAVAAAWQHWITTVPDELWSNCELLASGSAGPGPSVEVSGVFIGTADALDGALGPLQSAVGSAPSYRSVGAQSYVSAMLAEAGCSDSTVAQCHLPSQNPAGTLQRVSFDAKSAYLASPMSLAHLDAVIQAVESLQASVPSVQGGVAFDSGGGAIDQVAPDATAYVHRNALASIQYSATWSSGAPSSVGTGVTTWLDQTSQALAPAVDGQAYQNYIDPTLADWPRAYYGSNLARLVSAKRAYDPDDLFHFAQSIPTRMPA
ncbi:MAG TPA: FAD-binding oxidoreductase [Acidimicrobiales bacterium]|nr:FAD-binding oxidoreductase [Acidimicrobiales bacterium]